MTATQPKSVALGVAADDPGMIIFLVTLVRCFTKCDVDVRPHVLLRLAPITFVLISVILDSALPHLSLTSP